MTRPCTCSPAGRSHTRTISWDNGFRTLYVASFQTPAYAPTLDSPRENKGKLGREKGHAPSNITPLVSSWLPGSGDRPARRVCLPLVTRQSQSLGLLSRMDL